MVDISPIPGLLSVSDTEILKWSKWLINHISIPFDPFKEVSTDEFLTAINNLVKYLLMDNILEGLGQGGWGHSDRKYMEYLYGGEEASRTNDSVSTTVVVVEALYEYLSHIGSSKIESNQIEESPIKLRDLIVLRLNNYLLNRWDSKTGAGGALSIGREGDPILAPRYRHTASLLRLWTLLPGQLQKSMITAKNIIDNFKNVSWEKEKVATDVAAYKALDIIQNNIELFKLLGEDEVIFYKNCLKDQIVSKYNDKIEGWTSGKNPIGGRQLYTLFVLVEMADIYKEPSSLLSQKMTNALKATMRPPWNDSTCVGLPLKPNSPANINTSSLAVSALLRKPSLDRKEKEFLVDTTKYVVNFLSTEGSGNLQEAYSWALSYLLKDLCQFIPK